MVVVLKKINNLKTIWKMKQLSKLLIKKQFFCLL